MANNQSYHTIVQVDGTVRCVLSTSEYDVRCAQDMGKNMSHSRESNATVYVKRISTDINDYPVCGMALPRSTIIHSTTAYVDGRLYFTHE